MAGKCLLYSVLFRHWGHLDKKKSYISFPCIHVQRTYLYNKNIIIFIVSGHLDLYGTCFFKNKDINTVQDNHASAIAAFCIRLMSTLETFKYVSWNKKESKFHRYTVIKENKNFIKKCIKGKTCFHDQDF